MKPLLKSSIRKFLNIFRIFFLEFYKNTLKSLPNNGEITLIDIGATGDIEPRWKPFEEFLNYIGFEPDERSRKKILSQKKSVARTFNILPYAVWDSSKKIQFNLTREPETSSIYTPNKEFLDKFPNNERFDIIKKLQIDVKKIDELGINEVDFIKIDIQGGELNSLIGGSNLLEKTFGLELEIEFLPLYKEQPLFGDVCEWLAKKGFEFIDFSRLVRWERKNLNEVGQCVFGDALFLKPPEVFLKHDITNDRVCSYLSILVIYRRFDLIETSINILPSKKRNELSKFLNEVRRLKKIDKVVRSINSFNAKIISLFGYNYKSHIIY